ncbi:thiamine phosphate synthase [Intrasporangium sp. DVR]|uniref:thiamine phosphate synthase n=1 Tax=Intrasporangium sp. DVR TaxID=3127867 RepID=UPI00313A6D70
MTPNHRPFPRLHVLTDTRGGRDPLPEVRCALATGPVAIQVRAKDRTDRDVFALTTAVLELARGSGALVVVDDRADIALAAGAHGVHLGGADLPVADVRRFVPAGFVVGATVRDPDMARDAERSGASYLGAGPAHPTTTKQGLPGPLGPPGIRAVTAATSLPVIAIGGVTPELVPDLRAAGAHGVAVVAALSEAADPAAAAAALAAALTDGAGQQLGVPRRAGRPGGEAIAGALDVPLDEVRR